jgi:toxin ParE1/3/4
MAKRRWSVVFGAEAERDLATNLAWTTERFGERQARVYKKTLLAAVRALEEGPTIVGAKHRDDIRPGLMSLHVARGARRGRHFIMFRVVGAADSSVIQVIRLLHDAMDLARQMRAKTRHEVGAAPPPARPKPLRPGEGPRGEGV